MSSTEDEMLSESLLRSGIRDVSSKENSSREEMLATLWGIGCLDHFGLPSR